MEWCSLSANTDKQESHSVHFFSRNLCVFSVVQSVWMNSQGFAASERGNFLWFMQLVELNLKSSFLSKEQNFSNSRMQSLLLFLHVCKVDFWKCSCQGWTTNVTPTRHNATHNTRRKLNFSCPHIQKIMSPASKPAVSSAHWAAVSGIKANPMYKAVELNVIRNP